MRSAVRDRSRFPCRSYDTLSAGFGLSVEKPQQPGSDINTGDTKKMDWSRGANSPVVAGNWSRTKEDAGSASSHSSSVSSPHSAHTEEKHSESRLSVHPSQDRQESPSRRKLSIGSVKEHAADILGHLSDKLRNSVGEDQHHHSRRNSAGTRADSSTPSTSNDNSSNRGSLPEPTVKQLTERQMLEGKLVQLDEEAARLKTRLAEIDRERSVVQASLDHAPKYEMIGTQREASSIKAAVAMTAIQQNSNETKTKSGMTENDIVEVRRSIQLPRRADTTPHPKGIIRAISRRDLKEPTEGEVTTEQLLTLIEHHGEASHTALLEPEYVRYYSGAGVVGYIPSGKYAIVMSDPLCRTSDLEEVIASFVDVHCKKKGLKVVWLVATEKTQKILSTKYDWSAIACAKEDVVDLTLLKEVASVRQSCNRAKRAGCDYHESLVLPPVEVRDKVEHCLEKWQKNRKGDQLFITNIKPWDCQERRRWYWVTEKTETEENVVGFATLHKLPESTWSVEHAIIQPDAPKGASELLLWSMIQALSKEGELPDAYSRVLTDLGFKRLTFGVSAADELTPVHNLSGLKVQFLTTTYKSIASSFHLTNRGDFRKKFNAHEVPVYICFQKFGAGTVKALLATLVSHD
ncbi:hypothetical protein PROFUN_08343 [Planoprotostelium fungivorum]|uniref:Phosphatidylglycerol lysyltransferase C-terminal domain-containing protein n=1 Tax=Planoprotostelium fungivorum TaxID=1890364 RepID=A0A2P6NI51_9EUKA|nr:hypothetical protein PROFUN_08343 [Planoprotostelium fungivorum]